MSGEEGSSRSTAAALAIAAVLVFLYLVRGILMPFVVTGILAFVCTPLVDALTARLHLPRWLFAMAIVLVLMAGGALVVWLAVPALVHQTVRVTTDLEGAIQGFIQALIGRRDFSLLGVPIDATSLAASTVAGVRRWLLEDSHIGYLAAYAGAGFFGYILAWVLLGYFLVDAHRIAQGMLWLIPPSRRPFALEVWSDLDPLLRRYFVGVALVVVYASTAAYIGLGLALGLHHAVLLALLTGILEVFPIVGPAAAAIIAGLVAVRHAATSWDILAYIVYATALRISIDQFFGPIVLGRAARVRPVVVIFCFLAGGVLLGVLGVILAVPAALTVKVVLAKLYNEPQTGIRSP